MSSWGAHRHTERHPFLAVLLSHKQKGSSHWKLASSPGWHDVGSKGHGPWLLFRLLFPAPAFSQRLQSGGCLGAACPLVRAEMPLPRGCPRPAAPGLPCRSRVSQSVRGGAASNGGGLLWSKQKQLPVRVQ